MTGNARNVCHDDLYDAVITGRPSYEGTDDIPMKSGKSPSMDFTSLPRSVKSGRRQMLVTGLWTAIVEAEDMHGSKQHGG